MLCNFSFSLLSPLLFGSFFSSIFIFLFSLWKFLVSILFLRLSIPPNTFASQTTCTQSSRTNNITQSIPHFIFHFHAFHEPKKKEVAKEKRVTQNKQWKKKSKANLWENFVIDLRVCLKPNWVSFSFNFIVNNELRVGLA